MATYFSQVSDGRLKFNLEDMDNTRSESLITWELQEIVTAYPTKADYYEYNVYVGIRKQFTPIEAENRIAYILGPQ